MSEPTDSVGTRSPSTTPPEKPRLSWRTFALGWGAGVATVILALMVLFGGVLLLSRLLVGEDPSRVLALPLPDFPTDRALSVYGRADPSWRFQTMSGTSISLGTERGKVVFLDFWATWCGPCDIEMPIIERLRNELKNEPVDFVLASEETAGDVQRFVASKKITLPVFRIVGPRPGLLEIDAIPTTFIVDRNGMIVLRQVGLAQWDSPATVRFIRSLVSRPLSPNLRR